MHHPKPRHLFLTTLVLVTTLVVSCQQVTDIPPVGATTRQPDRDRVIVYVEWTADIDKIGKQCDQPSDYGCAVTDQLGPTDYACRIYVQRPSDFNDHPRLAVLGHELSHCFGGQHQ